MTGREEEPEEEEEEEEKVHRLFKVLRQIKGGRSRSRGGRQAEMNNGASKGEANNEIKEGDVGENLAKKSGNEPI